MLHIYFHLFGLTVDDPLILNILGWCVTIVGTLSFWAVPRHPAGWMVAIGSQVFYIPYVLINHEWGFLAHAICFSTAFIHNFVYDERHPRIQEQIASGKRKSHGKTMV